MFNLKEFIINNLIKGVNNKSFSKEYASILATNYFIKGIISEEDISRFDVETTETVFEEVTENEEVLDEVAEEIVKEIVENTDDVAEV